MSEENNLSSCESNPSTVSSNQEYTKILDYFSGIKAKEQNHLGQQIIYIFLVVALLFTGLNLFALVVNKLIAWKENSDKLKLQPTSVSHNLTIDTDSVQKEFSYIRFQ